MKAVLISINPEYCALIANGKKTIEVRKSKPKLDTPFKCYIYCTSSDVHSGLVVGGGYANFIHCGNYKTAIAVGGEIGNGKVIGEFVCDKVNEIMPSNEYYSDYYDIDDDTLSETCLIRHELHEYGEGKKLHGWHISDLKIYDRPKALKEFFVWKKCNSCRDSGYESTACCYDVDCKVPTVITRPPQSWCYVEERPIDKN